MLRARNRGSAAPPGRFEQARQRWALRVLAACVLLSGTAWSAALAQAGNAPRASVAGAPGNVPVGPLARLHVAGPLAVGPTGALYVVDVAAHRVLVRLADGRFRAVAGTGSAGFTGDGGPAVDARLSDVSDLAFSPSGSLYLADGGRVRVIDKHGLIESIAGDGHTATTPISTGIRALSAPLGSSASIRAGNPLSIAFGRNGQLYIATGPGRVVPSQLLRLTGATLTNVRAVVASGTFRGQPVPEIGRLAVDALGNLYTSGGYGAWPVWQITQRGVARKVGSLDALARRSGGNDSVLERGPGGVVYAEDGPTVLSTAGLKLVPSRQTAVTINGQHFSLTYFNFGPAGTLYADDIPGGGGFEAYQQLIAFHNGRATLLWQEPNTKAG